jgi:NAD(P)-dependent dehydrogenase (short-subunit alcohol dehydrogenase family)
VKLSSKSKLEGKIALITGGNSGIGLANSEEPTLASVWHSVAGSFISDELLKWPADLFALTDVILERLEVYRFVLSPASNTQWPPTRIPNWLKAAKHVRGGGVHGDAAR